MAEEVRIQVSPATDVWAFGMTVVEVCIYIYYHQWQTTPNMLQILTNRLPFSHIVSAPGVIFTVMNGGRPERSDCPQIPDEIWMTLEKCWAVDPNQRPSSMSLCHFFTSFSTDPLDGDDDYASSLDSNG